MKILLVEDQIDVAASTQMVLKVLGHEVQVARDGKAALDLASHFVPHVALIDMGLPDMCGIQVGMAVRDLPGWSEVFMIALTGYNYEDECYRAGFDLFQFKPMNFQHLSSLIAEGSRNPKRLPPEA